MDYGRVEAIDSGGNLGGGKEHNLTGDSSRCLKAQMLATPMLTRRIQVEIGDVHLPQELRAVQRLVETLLEKVESQNFVYLR